MPGRGCNTRSPWLYRLRNGDEPSTPLAGFWTPWGALAVEFQWTLGELFDVPCHGERCGLIWLLAVCGKTGKFELLPFRYGALCWWFSRLARHKRLFLGFFTEFAYAATNFGMRTRL